ncbi:MAG: hypothetical protein Q8O89_07755 [Nanoarchaeota archaeon]|nr:hypothetical protein [Nanoarchaeota archaeon]
MVKKGKIKKMEIEDLAVMMAKSFLGIENRLTQKIEGVESGLTQKIEQVSTDLKSFKIETRERFDTLEKKVDGIDENINAVITDYHPKIKLLEEKVFGFSTLE